MRYLSIFICLFFCSDYSQAGNITATYDPDQVLLKKSPSDSSASSEPTAVSKDFESLVKAAVQEDWSTVGTILDNFSDKETLGENEQDTVGAITRLYNFSKNNKLPKNRDAQIKDQQTLNMANHRLSARPTSPPPE